MLENGQEKNAKKKQTNIKKNKQKQGKIAFRFNENRKK